MIAKPTKRKVNTRNATETIQTVGANVTPYHSIYVVRGTNKKVKCTSTAHYYEEARERLTHRRQSLTNYASLDNGFSVDVHARYNQYPFEQHWKADVDV